MPLPTGLRLQGQMPLRRGVLLQRRGGGPMKAMLPTALVAVIAPVTFGSLLARTPVVHAVNQMWTGVVSSSHCGLSHPADATPRDCTLECVGHGAAFVLISNGTIYKFANQADERLRANAGEIVTVRGDLDGDVISASAIEGGR